MITLATATAVLRQVSHFFYCYYFDYIGYCYGGIETKFLSYYFFY